jgi:hypothetical protein
MLLILFSNASLTFQRRNIQIEKEDMRYQQMTTKEKSRSPGEKKKNKRRRGRRSKNGKNNKMMLRYKWRKQFQN